MTLFVFREKVVAISAILNLSANIICITAAQYNDKKNEHGIYTGLVYLTPIIGGFLADKILDIEMQL